MSVAARFKFAEAFPFCVEDISGVVPANSSFIANLTLAEIMSFAWNLETLTITTAGTATVGALVADAAGDLCINPWSSTRFDEGSTNDGMWFGEGVPTTALGSLPAIRDPDSRVCVLGSPASGAVMDILFSLSTARAGGNIRLYVGTDPVNSGRYRLYYFILYLFSDPATETIDLFFANYTPIAGTDTAGSGTITLGGLTFNWYAACTIGAIQSGITMTATSSLFTYP